MMKDHLNLGDPLTAVGEHCARHVCRDPSTHRRVQQMWTGVYLYERVNFFLKLLCT